ncbi:MAG: metalloregulator ArsR/SmtB family transcription factor [Coriobacteriia bacterium]|nr:metalloregulator ArsR/SmtB family transcription factor [Coriobacteriia bacterium]
MDRTHNDYLVYFKALADTNRLMIIEMLSCGELCACIILEGLNITQSTLSHHMRILCDSGLVVSRKEGKWMYYSLDTEVASKIIQFIEALTTAKGACACLTEKPVCESLCEQQG